MRAPIVINLLGMFYYVSSHFGEETIDHTFVRATPQKLLHLGHYMHIMNLWFIEFSNYYDLNFVMWLTYVFVGKYKH